MYIKWTSHCKTENEKLNFELDLRRAKPVLERLQQILDQRTNELTNEELNKEAFASAAWPYFQAANVGARSEIKYLRTLIDLDKQKDTINE